MRDREGVSVSKNGISTLDRNKGGVERRKNRGHVDKARGRNNRERNIKREM